MFGIFQCILRKDGGISLPERMRAELEGKPLCGWGNQDEGRTVRVGVRTVSAEGQQYGVPAGAYVATVEEGGPAAQAGVQVGDVITALNGDAVTTQQELTSLKSRYQPGDTVTLTVDRDGESLELDVVLGTTPEEDSQPAVQPSASIQEDDNDGGWYNGWPFGFGF